MVLESKIGLNIMPILLSKTHLGVRRCATRFYVGAPEAPEVEKNMKEKLPIVDFKNQILGSIDSNNVTIIRAQTGAGKSTQVPQFLLEAGFSCLITQPRRIAARTVAERVASEQGCELGTIVGYRTGEDRNCSPDTKCLFVTDGLALVRELIGTHARRFKILIIDEVHEWNINVEVLTAWVKHRLEEDSNLRVVLMSATLEVEELSQYFDRAQVIDVPGRLFDVENRPPQGRDRIEDIISLLRSGHNVLAFEAGKAEIEETMNAIQSSGVNAEVLPLHGELDAAAQRKCFIQYGRPLCVVATNVAQTSITIPGIDAVVDSGMERRVEVVGGVEGLYLKPISYADSNQRKGRAGRCKEGVYIDWCPEAERPEYSKPEIQRLRLDQTVLRLAEAGFDMEELHFFHQPPPKEIHKARLELHALGCIDKDGKVTKLGHNIAHLPTSVMGGRMIIEGFKRGVLADILKIVSILEQGGITERPRKDSPDKWRRFVFHESRSDVLAQLHLYNYVDERKMKAKEMLEIGVFPKSFFSAKEMERKLIKIVLDRGKSIESTGDREQILKSVLAGMINHVYQGIGGSSFVRNLNNLFDDARNLGKSSVVYGGSKPLIVAFPFDLTIQGRFGLNTINLLQMVTVIQPEWLSEIAPELVDVKIFERPYYTGSHSVQEVKHLYFNGCLIRKTVELKPIVRSVVPVSQKQGQFGSLSNAFDALG